MRLTDCERCGRGVGFKDAVICFRCRAADREASLRSSCAVCGRFLRLDALAGRCIRCGRTCVDCGHAVRNPTATRCHLCRRRFEVEQSKSLCSGCGRLGHIREATGWCGLCSRSPNKPLIPTPCTMCGELRRKVGSGLCRNCWQRDPERPFRRVENLLAELVEPPDWLPAFVEYAAQRHCGARVCVMLTAVGRLLTDGGSSHPQAILERSRRPGRSAGSLARTLEDFFVGDGLAFGLDQGARLAKGRRDRRVAAVPDSLRPQVADYATEMVAAQQRAHRVGTHARSDVTIESSLAIVRDFALFLLADRKKEDWSVVEISDVESFLLQKPRNRTRQLGGLRSFFRFARKHKIVLVDPTAGVPLTKRSPFKGVVLTAHRQRQLFSRWTSDEETVEPSEALVGVLALLHAASNAEVRLLKLTDIDWCHRTICLGERPYPVPIDPVTESVLKRALAHRETLSTKNPHIIVTRATKTRSCPASAPYITHVLDSAGVSTKALRQTRILDLVNRLDPKVAAEVLGMNADGLATYVSDDVNAVLLVGSPNL
jgi:site-specific recombinase XerD